MGLEGLKEPGLAEQGIAPTFEPAGESGVGLKGQRWTSQRGDVDLNSHLPVEA